MRGCCGDVSGMKTLEDVQLVCSINPLSYHMEYLGEETYCDLQW